MNLHQMLAERERDGNPVRVGLIGAGKYGTTISAIIGRSVRPRFAHCFFSVLAVTLFAGAAEAGCRVDISNYVGWQIIYSGTVTGYVDDSGREIDEFEGCEYGRVLIIDYTRTVTCAEYSYSYAYHPDIVILSNGYRMEACIDGEMFDVQR